MAVVFPTLYTRDVAGAVRFWRMEIDISDPSSYRSVSGVLGGAEVPTGWTKATPKNAGRSNATTAEEQAVAEVEAQYKQKRDRKYHDTVEGVGSHKFFAPMLAHKYESYVKQMLGLTAFIQPKLDGYRCVATSAGLTSRQGKPFHLPHIMEALDPLFDQFPDLILDGELYNHGLKDNFNELGSLIKKEKRTPPQEDRVRELVQYHVYDAPSIPRLFGQRFADLTGIFIDALHVGVPSTRGVVLPVETYAVRLESELDARYAQFIQEGYEGAMVRLDAPYDVGRRSKSLLKRKDFLDGEFELVRVEEGEGNWAGYAKTAVIRLADGTEQSAGMRGSQSFLSGLLITWRMYKQVTVRYQNLTPDGLLRFPVITDWHKGKREH